MIIYKSKYSTFTFRLDNGTFIGMIREVQDGIVDASIAGFSATQERFEVVDFSQGLFPYLQTLIIKRPLKTDISVRYFWLGKRNHLLSSSSYQIIFYLKQNTPKLLG